MLKSKRLLLLGAGAILIIILLGAWAKHDADAKAQAYTAAQTKLQASYKTDIAKLKLSSLIDVNDYGNEDATKQYAVCKAADSLQKRVENLSNDGLGASVGSFLSSPYRQARTEQQHAEAARANASKLLASYEAKCNYYAEGTKESNAEKAIGKSNAYRSLLNYNSATCKSAGGCISRPNYQAFTKVYAQIVAARKSYADYYQHTKCPLTGPQQQQVCALITKLAVAGEDDAVQYVAALKQGNTSKINELARNGSSLAAYHELNAYTKKLNPNAKTVDDYWRQLLIADEQQLAQIRL